MRVLDYIRSRNSETMCACGGARNSVDWEARKEEIFEEVPLKYRPAYIF